MNRRRRARLPIQYCEIDRRARQPRQLAGASGSSARCKASFIAGALTGATPLDADRDRLRTDDASDDDASVEGAADAAFNPNCLGIQTSLDAHPTKRDASS
jgi:hypothetical protein